MRVHGSVPQSGTLSAAAISFLGQHGRRYPALGCHRGSGEAEETLVRLVGSDLAKMVCEQALNNDGRGWLWLL